MLKQSLLATVAAVAFGTSAMADVPILSGKYVANVVENCVALDGTFSQLSGIVEFDPSSGKVDQDVSLVSGNPLNLQNLKAHGTYSNSKSTLTLDTNTFQATYGNLSKGIATYVSYIGLVENGPGNCGVQGWLSHK